MKKVIKTEQFIVACLLCITFSNRCVLIKLDVFKLAHRYVFLLHERHINLPQADMDQVTSIQSILNFRAQQGSIPLHLATEVPIYLNGGSYIYHKVTRNILAITQKLRLKYRSITAENIEIRSAEGVALDILNAAHTFLTDPEYKNWTESIGQQQWVLGKITFRDLIQELYNLKLQAQIHLTITNHNQEILNKIREEKYKTILQDEALLHTLFAKNKLKADMLILDAAIRLDYKNKDELSFCIRKLFSSIFDIHCLRTLCKEDASDKALIVGSDHATWVGSALDQLQATHIISHNPGLLSREHLSVLADYRSARNTIL